MPAEPFIMRDANRALEWVRVFSESCAVPTEFAAELLTSLCGFGSWDVMMFAIENMPPSPFDEAISPDQVHERKRHYIALMANHHGIKPIIAFAVTDLMSPSTGTPLHQFDAAEILEVFGEEDEDDVWFGSDDFHIDQIFGNTPSEAGTAVVPPLSGELNDCWLQVFEFLGWETDSDFYPSEVTGSPSFLLEDISGESPGFPVYLTHDMPSPSFERDISDNPTVRLVQCACLGDFVTDWASMGSPGFLLLTAYPQLTRRNGKFYCFIGKMYVEAEGHWIDLLLNKACRDPWSLLQLNSKVTEDFRGASKLGERTELFAKRVALLLSGFDPEFDEVDYWCIVAMSTGDGWSVVGGASEMDYDIEDLEPYMLAPLRKF